ncbi:hypothetical protein BV22DRAFT_1135323 [Leucogyrophana mollusca]|uniref:Uncharacterized protein n=1 Tax=Leucogyrophana mollusca TaxID=85980 RepID=A0ACB8AVZ3_9AGAM|nr:hypothetical protein BV22DRAFT_1135323 [Leucogyrophana mollusca]
MAKDVEEAVRPLQTIPAMTPMSTIATDYRRRMTDAMVTTEEAAQAATTDEKATPGLNQIILEGLYADHMAQLEWAKDAWSTALQKLDIKISSNDELITMITCRTLHLTGQLKSTMRPLVATLYNFKISQRLSVQNANRRLVQKLKYDFGMPYHELRSTKTNTKHSGFLWHKIIETAINLGCRS